jgi:hypothetical protein
MNLDSLESCGLDELEVCDADSEFEFVDESEGVRN